MSDLREILREESEARRRHAARVRAIWIICVSLYALVLLVQSLRGRGIYNDIVRLAPLLVLSTVAVAYTPRHRESLRAAISDPRPELDRHFAEVLDAEETPVAALARQAFVERFRERLPMLDEAGWLAVAQTLRRANEAEAETMLGLLREGAESSGVIPPLETYATAVRSDRLRTAARMTLADVRMRVAKGIVGQAVSVADAQTDRERERLGLGEPKG